MKKALIVAALLACALAVFADDGTVLPAGVLRARVIPTYGWVPGEYDKDGNYKAFPISPSPVPDGAITSPNLGFALEYGVNDWVTLGLQWAPGITFGSKVPTPTGFPIDLTVNGLYDLFAGVMVQIVGPKAPVVSDVIRFDLTPGVKIPLGGTDLASQTGSTQVAMNPDKQTLGIGGRLYLDYVFSQSLFLDLYTQFIDYPNKELAKYNNYGGDVDYGYDLRVELDPHYSTQISDGLTFSANCAFRYDAAPDMKIDGTTASDTAMSYISANPSVSLFLTKTFMPLEFTLDYGQPITGTNAFETYSVDLQIKAYFKL